ncbi:hypothetical protein DUNSADRAFT_11964 [Dunaliella salina]|uniref:LSM domain-containing protein n=1 Tax=Dunaliella salina TaxID=3046 RepID=A0ABQ7GCB1_DUNSA|nr:hypothetical protein DUNSADRAFT_11964 [Dunaliella salina]|eukprot:KAF5832235.1 hypothetical protein DUNSADRAFT_11964 [Dunaliella salina]
MADNASTSEPRQYSRSLDFFSADFDASLALLQTDLQPPDPTAPALDYTAKCRPLLPPEMPESLAGKERASKQKTGAEARYRVRVDTRHASGRRGSAVGTLIAYDRYMNLILLDVLENYTVLLKVPRIRPKLKGSGVDPR